MSLTTINRIALEVSISIACLSEAGFIRRDNGEAFIVTYLPEAESTSSSSFRVRRVQYVYGSWEAPWWDFFTTYQFPR